MGVAVIGAIAAALAPVGDFENFLYLIGSVFAPMVAILLTDHLLFGNDSSRNPVNAPNLVLWLAGFVLYRFSMSWDFVLGNTLPVMIIVALATLLVGLVRRRNRHTNG